MMQILSGSTRGHSNPDVLELHEGVSVAYGVAHRQRQGQGGAGNDEAGATPTYEPITTRNDPPVYRDALNRIYLMFDAQARE